MENQLAVKQMVSFTDRSLNTEPMSRLFVNYDAAYTLRLIFDAQRAGKSCLPNKLGLADNVYEGLVRYLNARYSGWLVIEGAQQGTEDLRQELLQLRYEEWLDIQTVLIEHRAGHTESESWFASIIAAACLGGDHLWRDLGLPNRQYLSELMSRNFPLLAEKNFADMKWKKFLYKQLCEREGAYVCRAPSCEQCAAYDDCFGPED